MRTAKLTMKILTRVVMTLLVMTGLVTISAAQTPPAPARAGGAPAPPMTLTTNGQSLIHI